MMQASMPVIETSTVNRDIIKRVLDGMPERDRTAIVAVFQKISDGRLVGSNEEKRAFELFIARIVSARDLKVAPENLGIFLGRLNPLCAKMTNRIGDFLEKDVLTLCINHNDSTRSWADLNAFLLVAYYMHLHFSEKQISDRAYG